MLGGGEGERVCCSIVARLLHVASIVLEQKEGDEGSLMRGKLRGDEVVRDEDRRIPT